MKENITKSISGKEVAISGGYKLPAKCNFFYIYRLCEIWNLTNCLRSDVFSIVGPKEEDSATLKDIYNICLSQLILFELSTIVSRKTDIQT